MRYLLGIIISACLGLPVVAQAEQKSMFVSGDNLNVRLCAASSCCIAGNLGLYEQVDVFEERDGWARISLYYDVTSEPRCQKNQSDLVARWVSIRYLSEDPPAGFDPNFWGGDLGDRRIRGIPKVGDYGLSRSEIRLLRRYAAELLAEGECTAIEAGNKSVARDGAYYVYCTGETEQRFFTASDIGGG